MHFIDWLIVGTVVLALILTVMRLNRYSSSVSDFLAANRAAGRYLLCTADWMAATGAVAVIAYFEGGYEAGFGFSWWYVSTLLAYFVWAMSGWVIYRFRQTRALTLAQFLEVRYSRKFRVFMGVLAFMAGVISFGIVPAVSARFFMQFCGLPDKFLLAGMHLDTFALLMLVLLGIALWFTLMGGQIAILVTDFLQGSYFNVVFCLMLCLLLFRVDWSEISDSLLIAAPDGSLIHPFRSTQAREFNIWYFLIQCLGPFYVNIAWQGSQAFNASARNPHEARMSKILGGFRSQSQLLMILLMPIIALAIMHHPDFAELRANVERTLSGIANPAIQNQVRVPLALREALPDGMMGLFAAAMFAAFISMSDTQLHSWGAIMVQDVLLPLRRRPLDSGAHLRLLKISIVAVAIFSFLFSLLFRQTEYILMFFSLTGALFVGGAGIVVIGGLYWSRGTTFAAWCAMFTGTATATCGIALTQFWPLWQGGAEFPLNGVYMLFISMVASTTVYVLASLIVPAARFDMDRMLHRGRWAIDGERPPEIDRKLKSRDLLYRRLGISAEFTRGDKLIYLLMLAWSVLLFGGFIGGCLYNFSFAVDVSAWLAFWHGYVWFLLALGVITTIWFTWAGFCDLFAMLRRLHESRPDASDDGQVHDSDHRG